MDEWEITKRRRNENTGKKEERKEKREKSMDGNENAEHREFRHKRRSKYDVRSGPHDAFFNEKAALEGVIKQLGRNGFRREQEWSCSAQDPCESCESSTENRKSVSAIVRCDRPRITRRRFRMATQAPALVPTSVPSNEEPCFLGRAAPRDEKASPTNAELCFSCQATGTELESDASTECRGTTEEIERQLKDLILVESAGGQTSGWTEEEVERQFGDLIVN